MEVLHREEGSKGVFYIPINGQAAAEMTYVQAGEGKIIIDHTLVSDELRGHGAGGRLLEAAVQWARDKNMKIIPLCPFAKATMQKGREKYTDVLD
jgi:predicted GNAT family acetyltransferase